MDYNHKKKLNNKIKKITNRELYYTIYELIKDELYTEDGEKKFTYNSNGIFFDLNMLSQTSLQSIENLLNEENIVTSEITESENI